MELMKNLRPSLILFVYCIMYCMYSLYISLSYYLSCQNISHLEDNLGLRYMHLVTRSESSRLLAAFVRKIVWILFLCSIFLMSFPAPAF